MSLQLTHITPKSQNQQNTDIWFILQESEDFIKTDLTQLLKTDNRSSILNDYIADGENLIQGLNYHYNQNATELQMSKSVLNTCKVQLSSANNNYNSALVHNNEILYNNAIVQAKQARSCIGEQSVSISSLQNLNRRIDRYRLAVNKRTSYLQNNRNTIINNYELLDSKKLSELQSITSILNSTHP